MTKGAAAPVAPVTPRGEATRQRILDAAEEVFGQSGYYATSISEITRRAGVAQGTFYIYFPTKSAIFTELTEYLGKRLRAATTAAIADAPNRLEAERLGFAAFFQFVAEHRQLYKILQEAERVVPDATYAYYRRISQGYERGLRAAIESGEICDTHPQAIAYALMSIGHFLALRWLIWPDHSGAEQRATALPTDVFEAVIDFITRGLAAPLR